MTSVKLISWNDIEYVLAQAWTSSAPPSSVVRFDVYPNQMTLTVASMQGVEEGKAWLGTVFGRAFSNENIQLTSFNGPRHFPVSIEDDADETRLTIEPRPRFSTMGLIAKQQENWLPEALDEKAPPIFTFYSFKGGVGRTLSLCAFVGAISQRYPNKRLLIIDADLEAPGLTSLVKHDPGNHSADFSLTDFLNLAHAEQGREKVQTLAYARHAIQRLSLRVPRADLEAEHYFLPGFREPWQQLRYGVRPENLTQFLNTRWDFARLLAMLGKALGVDGIVVDLRAGLSEMASPLIFDPRTHRYLISSCSQQSIDGIELVLKEMSKLPFAPTTHYFDPEVVLTFVTDDLEKSGRIESYLQNLREHYAAESGEETVEGIARLSVATSPFLQEMLNLTHWRELQVRLGGNSLGNTWNGLVDGLFDPEIPEPDDLDRKREALARLTQQLVFAEQEASSSFLKTEALKNLAGDFQTLLPIANVVGGKGAGKTFTASLVTRLGDWSLFVSEFDKVSTNRPIPVWPLLVSSTYPKRTRKDEAERMGLVAGDYPFSEDENFLSKALSNPEISDWRSFWFEFVCHSLGIAIEKERRADETLVHWLKEKGRSMVVVIDGLEDCLSREDEARPLKPLRALLVDVPNRLREIDENPLGILCFVRTDYVRRAIDQNTAQFMAQYGRYELRWNRKEVFRLVLWVCQQVNILEKSEDSTDRWSEARIVEMLEPVWGKKLGTASSKEAFTHHWVIAALSDFKGKIQARDLMRLISAAASASQGKSFHGHLLTPTSIKGSIQAVSKEKVKELKSEYDALEKVFTKLASVAAEKRQNPFKVNELALEDPVSPQEIQRLIDFGVVIDDGGAYYFPEIYLYGLGFSHSRRGRNKILSLFRKAIRDR